MTRSRGILIAAMFAFVAIVMTMMPDVAEAGRRHRGCCGRSTVSSGCCNPCGTVSFDTGCCGTYTTAYASDCGGCSSGIQHSAQMSIDSGSVQTFQGQSMTPPAPSGAAPRSGNLPPPPAAQPQNR